MNIDVDVTAKLLAPLITALVGVAGRTLRPDVRLISYFGHIGQFKLPPAEEGKDASYVFTHSVIVANVGSKPAHNVRLMHRVLPENITLEPNVDHEINRTIGEIKLPVLAPKEQVTVSYLYYPPTVASHINHTTKCDECMAKVLHVLPQPQPSIYTKVLVWTLMAMGVLFLAYIAIKLALMFAL